MSIVDNQHSTIKRRLVACLFVFLCCLISLSFAARSESTALRHGPSSARAPAVVNEPQASTASYPNCRYGSIPVRNQITDYDTGSINLGWYLTSARFSPPRPNGIQPVHLVSVEGRDCPHPECPYPTYWDEATIYPPLIDSAGGLGQIVTNNPGSTWLVGNEPDRRYYQGDVLPSQYARAYHDVYTFVKDRDPSSQVAIGGIVQPTPLRLLYLDLILQEYVALYNQPMPVDVWNIHSYAIQEVKDSWGAGIPPGINDVETGVSYTKAQHGDPALFQQLVTDFRTWMKARGQQSKPLIITEYGILLPDWLKDDEGDPYFPPSTVVEYMNQTSNWLETYADPELGCPADDFRLVQRWNWWSLDDDGVNVWGGHNWNGWLFESPAPYTRTVFGNAFAAITSQIEPTGDLFAYRLRKTPSVPYVVPPTGTVTITLRLDIANPGNVSVDQPFVVGFYQQIGSALNLIATTTVTSSIPGCAGIATAEVAWPSVGAGQHQVVVTVDETDLIGEGDETNNQWRGSVLVGNAVVYLPVVSKS